MAPEIHLKMHHQTGKADVFALGVILFNMITGQAPFQKATYEDKNYLMLVQNDTKAFWQQVQSTLDSNFPALSTEFKSLIEFCLRLEPTERPLVS
jgi:serine/threonine protein kinase